jgi:hypothetical protein
MSEINPSDAGSRQFDSSSPHLACHGEVQLPEETVGDPEVQQQ